MGLIMKNRKTYPGGTDGLLPVDKVESGNMSAVTSNAVAEALKDIVGFDFIIVSSLPAVGKKGIIYLVPVVETEAADKDIYEEYIWLGDKYETLGRRVVKIDLSEYLKKTEAAAVATSGSYNDLNNKPAIPTNTNQLANGAGFITSAGSCAACTNADKVDGFHVSWNGSILSFNS